MVSYIKEAKGYGMITDEMVRQMVADFWVLFGIVPFGSVPLWLRYTFLKKSLGRWLCLG